jgi:hypothetical protein
LIGRRICVLPGTALAMEKDMDRARTIIERRARAAEKAGKKL